MNTDKLTNDITHSIIDHFRSKCDGHGYFYLDEEWAISKIVKKHLENLPCKEIGFKAGDRVFLAENCNEYAAESMADAIVESVDDIWLNLKWNKENPKCHGQSDGGYYAENFRKIDRDYELDYLMDVIVRLKNAKNKD